MRMRHEIQALIFVLTLISSRLADLRNIVGFWRVSARISDLDCRPTSTDASLVMVCPKYYKCMTQNLPILSYSYPMITHVGTTINKTDAVSEKIDAPMECLWAGERASTSVQLYRKNQVRRPRSQLVAGFFNWIRHSKVCRFHWCQNYRSVIRRTLLFSLL